MVVFHKADGLDILLSGSKNIDKSFEYLFLGPWLGTGLLTSNGDKWQRRRRLLTPSFHFEILNDFIHVMNEQADILVSVLNEQVKQKKEIDMFKMIGLCALDIICETAMGQNVNAQYDHDSMYVKAVGKMVAEVIERMINPAYWFDFIYLRTQKGQIHQECLKVLHDFSLKVIMERNAAFEESTKTKKRIAFLDMLLKVKSDDPTALTFDDIQEEVDTFMFEGHDTTTAAAAWACQLIGSDEQVQQKLHDEIDRVFGSSSRQLTSDDLGELKYLECVVKETLRLFPSVPFFSRTIQEDVEVCGRVLTKGTTANIFAYMIHRDEKYFPDPERFDPDRFLPENHIDRPPFAYIPFSAGKRNCIGQRFAMMEEKILLANILRNFEIKSLKTLDEVKPVSLLIIRPENGIPIELRPRVFTF